MTTPHPLALSDDQMAVVLTHARLVRPEWRGRFLEDIADQLIRLDVIATADVYQAVNSTLQRIGVAA